MVELGAGYGRWAVRAAAALRQLRPIPFHLIAVEGEPRHYRWLRQHLSDNRIASDACTLIEGVVSDHRTKCFFMWEARPASAMNPRRGTDKQSLKAMRRLTNRYPALMQAST
jgi:hypothetical protein